MHAPPARSLVVTLSLATWAAALGGCTAPGDSTEPVEQAAEAIQGGAEDEVDTSVVVLYNAELQELCTGSLLAPNLVLTAAHCVATTVVAGQSCSEYVLDGITATSNLLVSAATVTPMSTADYAKVAEVIALPEAGGGLCGQDLALVVLKSPLPEGAQKFLVPRVDEAVTNGETFAAVGYGGVDAKATDIGTRRRLDDLSVVCVAECMKVYWGEPEWIGNPAVPHSGGRPGDSGSPALDDKGRVIGVFNRHYEYPVGVAKPDILIYGSVPAAADWLRAGAKHAAEVAGGEAPPWASGWPTDPAYSQPIGGECGATCASGLCAAGECTRLCNDLAPCPEGHVCAAGEGAAMVCTPEAMETSSSGGVGGGGAGGDGAGGAAEQGGCSVGVAKGPVGTSIFSAGYAALLVLGLAARRRTRARRPGLGLRDQRRSGAERACHATDHSSVSSTASVSSDPPAP